MQSSTVASMRSTEEAHAEVDRLLEQARAQSLARAERDAVIARRLSAVIDFPFRYGFLLFALFWVGTVMVLAIHGHHSTALGTTLMTAPMLLPMIVANWRWRRTRRPTLS